MISVEQAIKIVEERSDAIVDWEWRAVRDSLHYQVHEAIFSPIDMPPFPQSAMDGYALHLHESNDYEIVGEIKAGDAHQLNLKAGEAVRIFTGAAVPKTANTVVMQEKTLVKDKVLSVATKPIYGANIRPQAEQIKSGALIMNAGEIISAASIGYLSTLGIDRIKVVRKPSVAILVTGNELLSPGSPLTHGKVYESNSVMLLAALHTVGCYDVSIHRVKDDYKATKTIVSELIETNDLLIVSGGISVGDYDFVGKALRELNVIEHFYKVKQKPGKPLFYGEKKGCSIFALPGNPAAALSCFYVYVCAALCRLSYFPLAALKREKAIVNNAIPKLGDRAQFLKAYVENGFVRILDSQSSAMLSSFSIANALVYLPEDYTAKKKGDTVTLIKLP